MGDDAPRSRAARRGYSLTYRGKTLLSAIDPVAQAERAVDRLAPEDRARTLFFIPSPLYGYGIEKLLSVMDADSAALCVEADERLLDLAREALAPLLRTNAPRLILAGASGVEQLSALVRQTWGQRRFRRVRTLRLTGGWQLAEDVYADILAALEMEIAGDWENALTLVHLGRRFIRNFIRNLPLAARVAGPAQTLDNSFFGDEPVLVLGAGPSLDGILDALTARFPPGDPGSPRTPNNRQTEERPKHPAGKGHGERPPGIIAVDTALRCLLARNIVPDLVVALESQHWNLRDFTGTARYAVPVAMDLSALPATAEMLDGRPLIFFTPWTALRLFGRLEQAGFLPPEIPALGSVGLTAVALALRLSRGPVITGGIDFSFTLDRFHARAAPGSDEALRRTTRLAPIIQARSAFREGFFPARGKQGETVISGGALKRYRDLFEREFSGAARLGDITGSGLFLGVPVLERDEALRLLVSGGGKGGAFPEPAPQDAAADGADKARRLARFMEAERELLLEIRAILTARTAETARLAGLLDECDYLWAHFPDCAGAGGRRPGPGGGGGETAWRSFLKRVRAEIDPFIALWERARAELPEHGGASA
ncbi:MAG: DUF115 domain-containing protein [Spirochaetaceae bacterium]|jgi:hypothetical protein|nr:DUF115 domain-containing protein [Spirochaetaceae bacterium]